MKISNITARMILDSRGDPTVEAEVRCENGGWGRASVPSGVSAGTHEAYELRDGNKGFRGRGVQKAVDNVNNEIREALMGISADDQHKIDTTLITLDGTKNKSRLGANALLAVSLAAAHAAAHVRGLPLFKHIADLTGNQDLSLPMPMFNVFEGGEHAGNNVDFQEYMIMPIGAQNYHEAIQMGAEIFIALKKELKDRKLSTTVGDEGGFAPILDTNTEPLDFLVKVSQSAGYTPGTDVAFALDVAASEFFSDNNYRLKRESRTLDSKQMIEYLQDIAKSHPVISIEDGLAEDEWPSWTELTACIPDVQIVGDDLLVTNEERLTRAIEKKAANAILVKPNQIGTLTETLNIISKAKEADWRNIISHRGGETEDTTIAHLAVGTGAGQIKTGSVSRGERTAKHNELMRIEEYTKDLQLANPFSIQYK